MVTMIKHERQQKGKTMPYITHHIRNTATVLPSLNTQNQVQSLKGLM
jgi:hypothetical protein